MKKNSMLVVFLLLIVFVLVVSGCGGGGGGGGKKASSNEDEISNESSVKENFFVLSEFAVETKTPSYINMLFHVIDSEGNPVTSLSVEDFEILEDEQSISLTESARDIQVQSNVPYQLYTLIMLDNSISIGADESNLINIKNAAKELISLADNIDTEARDNSTGKQYFKICSFSQSYTPLMDNFSNNTTDLIATIDSVGPGFNTTDLYGSINKGLADLTDSVTEDEAQPGSLILLTDGSDTSGDGSLYNTLLARGTKKIITIGIGAEINRTVLESLGNYGFYEMIDSTELTEEFVAIQEKVESFDNSLYLLNYLSPKNGDGTHTLTLKVVGNLNDGDDAEINSDFESDGFFSVQPGIYVNSSQTIPSEAELTEIAVNSSTQIRFNTYLSLLGGIPEPPEYSITNNPCGGDVVTMIQDPDDLASYTITTGNSLDACEITVADTVNGFTKSVVIDISEFGISSKSLFAYYAFENNLNDDSGNNNNITVSSVDYTADGSAIVLANKNDYVTMPTSVSSNAMTASMWYNHTHYLNTSGFTFHYTLLGSDDRDYRHLVIDESSKQIGFSLGNLSTFQISDGSWYHIVLIKDDINSKLYINGALRQESDTNFKNDLHPLTTIGNSGGSAKYEGATGIIDDVRIYDRALSEDEIGALYQENIDLID